MVLFVFSPLASILNTLHCSHGGSCPSHFSWATKHKLELVSICYILLLFVHRWIYSYWKFDYDVFYLQVIVHILCFIIQLDDFLRDIFFNGLLLNKPRRNLSPHLFWNLWEAPRFPVHHDPGTVPYFSISMNGDKTKAMLVIKRKSEELSFNKNYLVARANTWPVAWLRISQSLRIPFFPDAPTHVSISTISPLQNTSTCNCCRLEWIHSSKWKNLNLKVEKK